MGDGEVGINNLTAPLKVLLLLLPVSAVLLTGCATRFDTKTWIGTEAGEPVKHTRVTHSWWLGFPAIAPMDATITDGDFSIETKAMNVPTFDIGTLFEND